MAVKQRTFSKSKLSSQKSSTTKIRPFGLKFSFTSCFRSVYGLNFRAAYAGLYNTCSLEM